MIAVYTVLAVWLLWVFYVAVMRLKMVRDAGQLTLGMKVFGYPALLVGYTLDLAVNVVLASLVFAERPREWTLSERLWRLSIGPEGWRQQRALWWRREFLDAIDPSGIHRG